MLRMAIRWRIIKEKEINKEKERVLFYTLFKVPDTMAGNFFLLASHIVQIYYSSYIAFCFGAPSDGRKREWQMLAYGNFFSAEKLSSLIKTNGWNIIFILSAYIIYV